jgi:ribonuclease P protein component
LIYPCYSCRIPPCLSHITQRERSDLQPTGSSFVKQARVDVKSSPAVAHLDERSFPSSYSMLPKTKRIKSVDFKGLKTRLVYRGAFFDVSAAPMGGEGATTKFACVIAKKRIRRAVDRNTAKRKVYTLLKDVATTSPLFVFVYPTKQVLHAPHPSLQEEIKKAFATL